MFLIERDGSAYRLTVVVRSSELTDDDSVTWDDITGTWDDQGDRLWINRVHRAVLAQKPAGIDLRFVAVDGAGVGRGVARLGLRVGHLGRRHQ